MAKITFFDNRVFEGCSCEAITDQPDLHANLNCCNSCKVETGCWMIYEYPSYIGYQYLLRKGEYPDSQHWIGFSDSIRSCCIITAVDFHYRDIQSCNALEESWVFYEQLHF